jgi:pimeloyl-ACP methyl ester carboxylesterase
MQTKLFERPEGTLALSDYGADGDLVLMLPGMGALRSEYRYLAPRLAESGYHAVSVDLRGQGESSVPWERYDVPSVGGDILALIDHLNAGPAHVIGTSFAPAPAVWAWVAYYGTLYPSHKPNDFQDYLKRLRENLAERGRFDAVKRLGSSSRRPSEERLERVKVPTLVIMGTKDPDFPDPAHEGRAVADRVGGELSLIEGAGHYPQTEMQEKTTPVVLDFLGRSSG